MTIEHGLRKTVLIKIRQDKVILSWQPMVKTPLVTTMLIVNSMRAWNSRLMDICILIWVDQTVLCLLMVIGLTGLVLFWHRLIPLKWRPIITWLMVVVDWGFKDSVMPWPLVWTSIKILAIQHPVHLVLCVQQIVQVLWIQCPMQCIPRDKIWRHGQQRLSTN